MLKHFTLEISIIKSHQPEQVTKVAGSFQILELNRVNLNWICVCKAASASERTNPKQQFRQGPEKLFYFAEELMHQT